MNIFNWFFSPKMIVSTTPVGKQPLFGTTHTHNKKHEAILVLCQQQEIQKSEAGDGGGELLGLIFYNNQLATLNVVSYVVIQTHTHDLTMHCNAGERPKDSSSCLGPLCFMFRPLGRDAIQPHYLPRVQNE